MNQQYTTVFSHLDTTGESPVEERVAELRARYERGERIFGALDLRDANLWGAQLSEAQLAGANLAGADLRRATLRGANLRGADLSGALLVGADLTRADLRGANLRNANLYYAELTGALLDETHPLETTLYDPALSRARRGLANCR